MSLSSRQRLETALGHQFADPELLERALRHASLANEEGTESYERLEFLGDAVLGLVTAELLHEAHPGWSEGELTQARRMMVDGEALARVARELDLGEAVMLGATERQGGGASKASILGDALEALVGAVYLDAGLAPVRSWVQRTFAELLSVDTPPVARDAKSEFQERVMARFGIFPDYEVVHDNGIESDALRFTVAVKVQGERWAFATDRTKRGAEKQAASFALAHPGLADD